MKLSALVIDLTDGQYEYMLFFHGFLVGLPLNFQFRQIASLFLSLDKKLRAIIGLEDSYKCTVKAKASLCTKQSKANNNSCFCKSKSSYRLSDIE